MRWSAPTGGRPPFRLVTPGAALSVGALLLVASVGFDVFVTNIASYDETYGAFTRAIVLILWLWLVAPAPSWSGPSWTPCWATGSAPSA